MKFLKFVSSPLFLLLISCNLTPQQISKNDSCFDSLQLSYNLHYNYGKWVYKPIYKTNLIACLPDNSEEGLANVWEGKMLEVTELFIPGDEKIHSLDDSELYSKMKNLGLDDPVIHISVYNQGTWSGSSIKGWLEEKIGGPPRIPTWNKCKTLRPGPGSRDYKTVQDYPLPLYINYQSPIYPLINSQGDFVLFEGCNWTGTAYAILIEHQVYIIDFDHGFYIKNVKAEELLQAILRTLKVSD